MNIFRVVLFHTSTTLRFGRYDLFIYKINLFWLNLYSVISKQIKQWSHLEKFFFRVLGIIYRINIIYVEKRSQYFMSFQCHSHDNSFITKFGRSVNFVLEHFDNSHRHLDTKEHHNFFSIRFY